MAGHDIIVVGASAGGVEALSELVKNLPSNLNAAVFIVLHVPSHGTSVLPSILNRAKTLLTHHAKDGQAIVPGRIYIAPPNYHLLVKDGYVNVSKGATENSHRPAIDPTFRTAARAYGRRVVGVILTGTLDDGTAGLMAVKRRSGVAVVQDPDDAMYSGMPQSAIANVNNIDFILPLSSIPAVLVNLVNTPISDAPEEPVPPEMEYESNIAELHMEAINSNEKPGRSANLGCPSCGGTLWEIEENDLLRYRCRTGHAFSVESLLAEQSDALEEALWIALRALEEKSALTQRMAKRMRDRNQILSASRLEAEEEAINQRATIIRDTLMNINNYVHNHQLSDEEAALKVGD
jgi:two-component system chemotaxis response regulator CheB